MKQSNPRLTIFIIYGLSVLAAIVIVLLRLQPPKPSENSEPANPPQATIWTAVGDIACAPGQAKTADKCHQQEVANAVNKLAPSGILLLGDLQYDKGEPANFQKAFDGLFSKNTPLYPVPGNHEYYTSGAIGYFDYFGAKAGETGKGYYVFKQNGWLILALNSNCEYAGGCDKNSPQGVWLDKQLADNNNQCTLAFWHHPRFTSGPHAEPDSVKRSEYFWEVLDQYQADVILNGHEHFYERLAKQDKNAKKDASGIRQFTVGSGGKSLYKFSTKLANQDYGNDETFGFLKLSLYPKSYLWQFIDENGIVKDKGAGVCNSKVAKL